MPCVIIALLARDRMFRKLFSGGTPSRQAHSGALSYAVVDLETTGLFPSKYDRIIEIAVIRLNSRGESLDEFTTLINPDRDVGPTSIHGIRARDVLDAPRFDEVIGDVVDRLAGAVFVAHNARFDRDFLAAEFRRMGHTLPQIPVACTMSLARTRQPAVQSYKLSALCTELKISHTNRHSALGDARATAALFGTLTTSIVSSESPTLADLGCACSAVPPRSAWPAIQPSGKYRTRGANSQPGEPTPLGRLIDRLPAVPSAHSPAGLEYLSLLDSALEDRRVTADEADALFDTATRWGLARNEVVAIHDSYFNSLVALAREDGIVTESELADLHEVSELLGYTADKFDALMGAAPAEPLARPRNRQSLTGMSVCFTGESCCKRNGVPIQRSEAELLAAAAGLTVQSSVTKKLDILVLADPDSQSGKAKTARRYGTRLIAEPVFWREIGVTID